MTQSTSDRALGTVLARLPDPAAPVGLAQATMARLVRLDERAGLGMRTACAADARGDRWRAALAVVGHAAGIAALAFATFANGLVPGITVARVGGLTGLVSMPDTAPAAFVLAAGLLLYVTTLFAPFGRTGR